MIPNDGSDASLSGENTRKILELCGKEIFDANKGSNFNFETYFLLPPFLIANSFRIHPAPPNLSVTNST